ncbi:MAG: hypothetical protein ACTSUE_04745 [Promethearchaeota archaeon]
MPLLIAQHRDTMKHPARDFSRKLVLQPVHRHVIPILSSIPGRQGI